MDNNIYVESPVQYPVKMNIKLKRVKETKDLNEVVYLTQSGNWVVFRAYHCSDNKVLFLLGEIM